MIKWLAHLAICSTALFSQTKTLIKPLNPSDRVGFQGVGSVKMGMTITALKKAVGIPLTIEYDTPEECGFASPKSKSLRISFMIIKGKVVRTDVDQPGFRTTEGAQVGDSEKHILNLYKGRVKVTPHTYVDTGHYLTIKTSDHRYGLVFETDNGVVTSYRIGLLPAAEYIEGCS